MTNYSCIMGSTRYLLNLLNVQVFRVRSYTRKAWGSVLASGEWSPLRLLFFFWLFVELLSMGANAGV
jgi:hypothetical protein